MVSRHELDRDLSRVLQSARGPVVDHFLAVHEDPQAVVTGHQNLICPRRQIPLGCGDDREVIPWNLWSRRAIGPLKGEVIHLLAIERWGGDDLVPGGLEPDVIFTIP